MKTDYLNAKILSHRANLQRYATLLATQLTELEREYLHKRIEEERAEVASLEFARAAEAAQAKETVVGAEGDASARERAFCDAFCAW